MSDNKHTKASHRDGAREGTRGEPATMSDNKHTKASHRDRAREGTRGEPACLLSFQTARRLQRLGEGYISDHANEENTLDAKQSENEKTSELFWNVGMVFNKWMLFIAIVLVINSFCLGMAEASPHPKDKTYTRKDRATFQECTPPNSRWDKARGSPNTCDTVSKGITDGEGGLTVDTVTVLRLSKQMEDMNKMIVQLQERLDELHDRSGREEETLARQDAEAHKEDHSEKLGERAREVERFTSSSTETANTISTLSDRVERLEVWKTDFENMEIQKVRQDAEDAHHVAAGCVEKLETVIKDVGRMSGVVAEVKKLENSIEDVNKELTETKTKLTETSTKLTETNTKLTETSTKLTETNSKLVKVEDSTVQHERWKGVVQDTVIPNLKSQIGHLSKTAEDVKQATDKTGSLLNGHIVWANSTYAEFKNHRSDTNKKVSEFARKHDTTERKLDGEELDGSMTKAELDHLKGRTTVYDFAFLLTLLNIIAVVFVVMYVRQTPSSATVSSTAPASTTAASRNNVQRGSRREEVYELQWSRPMEDTVCVVAFHTETEGRHADQTRSVFESVQQPCPTIHSRVIRRHTDITQLPGSRVFLVFVDFNERNVILEDPTKGLGDLRVTTVRSLWRFGADVTVIYCRDQGSVNLDSRLFNQDLGSIHRQQELTQLKNDDRILSIYSDFSNTQRQHCRNFINRLLHVM